MLISHNLYLQQYINTNNGWNYELLMRASFYEREVYEMQATHGFTKRNQTHTQHHLSMFKLSWSKHNSSMANTIMVAPNLLNIGVWDSGLYCHLCLFLAKIKVHCNKSQKYMKLKKICECILKLQPIRLPSIVGSLLGFVFLFMEFGFLRC